MTNGNKTVIGDGTRVERHDPDVVAETIKAKEKLAIADEAVMLIDPEQARCLAERVAFDEWQAAEKALGEAYKRCSVAIAKWNEAIAALNEGKKDD